MKLSMRLYYFVAFCIAASVLLFSYYLQKYDGINPCPLCILQRFDMALLAVLFLVGTIIRLGRVGHITLNTMMLFISSLGIIFSGRQVWLQHWPPNHHMDCGVSLNYLMQVLPVTEVAKRILSGSAECSQLGWKFLGLSLADWSLGCFLGFFMFSLILLYKTARQR